MFIPFAIFFRVLMVRYTMAVIDKASIAKSHAKT